MQNYQYAKLKSLYYKTIVEKHDKIVFFLVSEIKCLCPTKTCRREVGVTFPLHIIDSNAFLVNKT